MSIAGRIFRVIAAALAGSLCVSGAAFLFITPQKIPFLIPYGTPAIEIIGRLSDEGLIVSRTALYTLFTITGTVPKVKAGLYEFNSRQTFYSIWRDLVRGRTLKIKLTVPEGYTIRQIARALEDKRVCPAADFEAYASSRALEGFLFPETYFFEASLPPEKIAEVMRGEFSRRYIPEFEARRKEHGFTLKDHVILASIIEKEARARGEKALVSAVFHNRLKKRMYLESCATIQYALGGWKKRITYDDLKIPSPYNTYTRFGLPPGPICNPGFESLYAAVYPAKSPALYFVADGMGANQFFSRYSEHLKGKEDLIKFRKAWNKKNKIK